MGKGDPVITCEVARRFGGCKNIINRNRLLENRKVNIFDDKTKLFIVVDRFVKMAPHFWIQMFQKFVGYADAFISRGLI